MSSTTSGFNNVEVSPRFEVSFEAIFRRISGRQYQGSRKDVNLSNFINIF